MLARRSARLVERFIDNQTDDAFQTECRRGGACDPTANAVPGGARNRVPSRRHPRFTCPHVPPVPPRTERRPAKRISPHGGRPVPLRPGRRPHKLPNRYVFSNHRPHPSVEIPANGRLCVMDGRFRTRLCRARRLNRSWSLPTEATGRGLPDGLTGWVAGRVAFSLFSACTISWMENRPSVQFGDIIVHSAVFSYGELHTLKLLCQWTMR